MVLTNEDIESIEDDDYSEIEESEPGSVWLEFALKNEGVTINALGLKRLMELDVGNAN